jgi:NAD(P) transhydrogenase
LGEGALTLSARHVVLATGSRPARPTDIPFDGALVLDAEDMNAIASLRARMCVIGFGVIGGEYASLLAALGVAVTVVHAQGPVLPMLDREVADAFCAQLAMKGVRVLTSTKVTKIEAQPGVADPVRVHLDNGEVIACDRVLYSQGRDAASASLNLRAAGITLGKYGRIAVEGPGRTSQPNVLAVGDVIGPPGLANAAIAQGRAAAESLFAPGAAPAGEDAAEATALWTLPEVAGIGLTEHEAKARGLDFVCGYGRFRDLPRGIIAGDLSGWAKLLVERGTMRVLGAHVIGESACDLIQHAVLLVRGKKTASEVAESGSRRLRSTTSTSWRRRTRSSAPRASAAPAPRAPCRAAAA